MKVLMFFIGMLVGSVLSFVFFCLIKVGAESDKHIKKE